MTRNVAYILWFCITGVIGLVIAGIKELPQVCENLRKEAEKIEQAAKERRFNQKR